MMHSQSLAPFAPPLETPPPAETAQVASNQSLTLDADGDGRVGLSELRAWLNRWRERRPTTPEAPNVGSVHSTPDAAPPTLPDVAAPRLPDVLPNVADYGGRYDWHLNAIKAPEAWAAGHTGQGVVVAVIDTGVDLRHSELRGRLWTNPDEVAGNGRDDDGNGFVDDVHGWDFVNRDATPQDRNGHGTHVGSLIAAERDQSGATGVAYGSQLMVLQGLGADGVGDTRDIANAVRYAVDEGADIINVSLSGGRSRSLDAALQYADSHGVLVVAAAGNQGAAAPNSPASLSQSLQSVISVGAFDQSNRLASFSNLSGGAVQVVAPGVRLRGAIPNGQALYSGTSMAAPLVTGVAALALSASPHLSGAQLRDLIVKGAQKTIVGDDSLGAVNAAVTVAQGRKWNERVSVASTPLNRTPDQDGRLLTAASLLDGAANHQDPETDSPLVPEREPMVLAFQPQESDTPRFVKAKRDHDNKQLLRLWTANDEGEPQKEMLDLQPPAVDAALRFWAA